MTELGLIFILVAWISLVVEVRKGDKTIQPLFLWLYSVGSIMIFVSDWRLGEYQTAGLNLVIAALAFSAFSWLKQKQ